MRGSAPVLALLALLAAGDPASASVLAASPADGLTVGTLRRPVRWGSAAVGASVAAGPASGGIATTSWLDASVALPAGALRLSMPFVTSPSGGGLGSPSVSYAASAPIPLGRRFSFLGAAEIGATFGSLAARPGEPGAFGAALPSLALRRGASFGLFHVSGLGLEGWAQFVGAANALGLQAEVAHARLVSLRLGVARERSGRTTSVLATGAASVRVGSWGSLDLALHMPVSGDAAPVAAVGFTHTLALPRSWFRDEPPASADVVDVREAPTDGARLADLAIASKITVVEFGAVWCAPCREAEAHLGALAESEPGLAVRRVDIDEHADLAASAGIRAIPYVVVFDRDRREIARTAFRPARVEAIVRDALAEGR